MKSRKDYNCHVLSNTHWDREWRYPFRSYQMDLVDFLDRLLDILDTQPEYRSFYLDSQTLLLEDYLNIRPENRERLVKHIKEGRLEIGPWYTLPDCWGCPGEALVRNLLFGHRDSATLGGTVKVGYTPFSNGQISQMPQLYRGFGIDSILFYRGIGKHIAPSDFIWKGPDGSWLYAFRFGDYARYNYYYLVYRNGVFGRTTAQRDFHWNPTEIPYHVANEQAQDRQYGWIDQKLGLHRDMLPDAVEDIFKMTAPDAQTSELLYMMGHDHSFAAKEEISLIKALVEQVGPEGEHIFHSCLTDYMKAFREKAKDVSLKVVEGEMRHTLKEGLWTTLMALILSCRLYLKQRNAQISRMVLDGAEPLTAMAWLTGSAYPTRFLEIAWRQILINHAHDAIGGCSVDKVHRAMLTRWDEVETIADELVRRSMRDVVSRINGSMLNTDDLQLTIFNTLPFKRTALAELTIDIPETDKVGAFTIITTDGKTVTSQMLSAEPYSPTIESGYETTMPFNVMRHHIVVDCEELPACGWRVYAVRAQKDSAKQDKPTMTNQIENEFLRAEVLPNGTVTLTDKTTGRIMKDLLYLEDSAEFGDPWNRKGPENDTPLFSKDSVKADVTVTATGALFNSLRIKYDFMIPSGRDGDQRSASKVKIPICFDLTLRKNEKRLDVKLTLDNKAKNHRLRLLMPSGVEGATHSYADGQFDVLERVITLPDATDWKEKPFPTHPMWSFVGVYAEGKGFSVLEDGLTEYEIIDDAPRTIAITLMRTFGTFVYGRPTPGSQCLGKHSYHFALIPHNDTWKSIDLPTTAKEWLTPIYALESTPTHGTLSTEMSMIDIKANGIQCSAIKQSEDKRSLVVRVYNPLSTERKAILTVGTPIEKAALLTLEEKEIEPLAISDNSKITLTIQPKQIVTIRLTQTQN